MLRILSNDEISIISEKKHLKVINEHSNYLVKAAESIRRKLLSIAVLASNFYDDTDRKLTELKAVISFLISILNDNIKQRISEKSSTNFRVNSAKIKQENELSDEDLSSSMQEKESSTDASPPRSAINDSPPRSAINDSAPVDPSSTDSDVQASNAQARALNISSLSEVFITKIIRDHHYQYIECDIEFKTRIEVEITRKLTKKLRIKLSKSIKNRLERDIISQFDKKIKSNLIKQLKEEITAEFRVNLKQKLKQELLLSLEFV